MISDEIATFLEDGQSIYLGTCGTDLVPEGARTIAATLDPDRSHMTLFVPEVAARRVIANLGSNGQAAVVFARPTDDRACQVKGSFVSTRAVEEHERAEIARQWERFQDKLEGIGITRRLVETWVSWPCVAMRIKVSALFSQTPGPGAGAPLS